MPDYVGKTIFEKCGDDIHIMAYGYMSDGPYDKPYRFVEYTFFIVSVEEVEKEGFYVLESEEGCEYK